MLLWTHEKMLYMISLIPETKRQMHVNDINKRKNRKEKNKRKTFSIHCTSYKFYTILQQYLMVTALVLVSWWCWCLNYPYHDSKRKNIFKKKRRKILTEMENEVTTINECTMYTFWPEERRKAKVFDLSRAPRQIE